MRNWFVIHTVILDITTVSYSQPIKQTIVEFAKNKNVNVWQKSPNGAKRHWIEVKRGKDYQSWCAFAIVWCVLTFFWPYALGLLGYAISAIIIWEFIIEYFAKPHWKALALLKIADELQFPNEEEICIRIFNK